MSAVGNAAPVRVMERLGMSRATEFEHPDHPEDSPLRRHVLYRLGRTQGLSGRRCAGCVVA